MYVYVKNKNLILLVGSSMTKYVSKNEWLFLIACIGLGWLAEISFLHGRIGISYPLFILGFYGVFFLRYRLDFQHRRIGMLMMVVIWMLASTFVFYDNDFFHSLNILVIPVLVFSHIVLITRPNNFTWETPKFIVQVLIIFNKGIHHSGVFIVKVFQQVFKGMNPRTAYVLRGIIIGLLIGVPLLALITGLLMSADDVFYDVVIHVPEFILQINVLEYGFRLIFIVTTSLLFFGIFQVLKKDSEQLNGIKMFPPILSWNSLTAITILLLLNIVYVLFVAIQFKYFFSGNLIEGMTYASYARRGFTELVVVMIINWTILLYFFKKIHTESRLAKIVLQLLYSLLIMTSGIMLASAFQRLSLYEAAYGFTIDRVLAHTFMIYLMIIFAYTLIRVWIERISLIHFFLIVGLIFYTGINVFNVEQFIVDKNFERYEETGKIDIYYLGSLSYTGWNGLIELYKEDKDFEEVEDELIYLKRQVKNEYRRSWQSFNFAREKFKEEISQLDLPEKSSWEREE